MQTTRLSQLATALRALDYDVKESPTTLEVREEFLKDQVVVHVNAALSTSAALQGVLSLCDFPAASKLLMDVQREVCNL